MPAWASTSATMGSPANDVGDGDAGANGLQNFPVLSAVATDGAGNVHIAGSLNAVPGVATYRVEFFAHGSADPTGFGEGRRYLGFTNVTTDAAGNAVIGVTLAASVTAATDYVTVTATDSANNTSEYARNVTAVSDLIVTTTADTVNGNTTSVAALIANPGGDGRISLREAILATNATPGTDTIRFGIPLTDAGHLYYQNDSIPGSLSTIAVTTRADLDITDFDPDYPGTRFSWYRISPAAALDPITGSVLLDGYTQPGASPNTLAVGNDALLRIELNGILTAAGVNGLRVNAINSTIQGLVVNNFTDYGIRIGAAGATIQGNFVGTNVPGTFALGNNRGSVAADGGGVALFAGGATIGGTAPAARNVVSGNAAGCARGIELWESSGNTIRGNYVGTNAAGTAAVANGCGGIVLDGTPGVGSDNNTIGGSAAGAGNLISGNVVEGIFVQIGSNNNTIQGNTIGRNATNTAAIPNGAQGIKLFAPANRVGGVAPGEGNVISGNVAEGVRIEGATSTGNSILRNTIYGNGAPLALGIDLLGNGVTANDVNDPDTGPNDLLNFPFVTAALESAGVLTAYFKLDVPAGSYRIELFKNPSGADPSGNGEGESFASAVNVTHPGGGSQNFNHNFAGVVGDVITATTTFCTDGAACTTFGSTSEFSNAITAVTTAVTLISFEAVARDGAVELSWRTGSELDNLGFHLYRSVAASGPYLRITGAVIPGLGSSPSGATYRYRDEGLENGVEYFYKLEDLETTGRSELHGPVSAAPEGNEDFESQTVYGDPAEVSFRILERSSKGMLI
jgi:parallel beta-helix repeat protein